MIVILLPSLYYSNHFSFIKSKEFQNQIIFNLKIEVVQVERNEHYYILFDARKKKRNFQENILYKTFYNIFF